MMKNGTAVTGIAGFMHWLGQVNAAYAREQMPWTVLSWARVGEVQDNLITYADIYIRNGGMF